MMFNIQPHLIELPPHEGTIMELYSTYSTFENCPNVPELLTEAVCRMSDPNMAFNITKHYTHTHYWNLHEQTESNNILVRLQQSITQLLHKLGIPSADSLELLKQPGYSLIMVVKEYT